MTDDKPGELHCYAGCEFKSAYLAMEKERDHFHTEIAALKSENRELRDKLFLNFTRSAMELAMGKEIEKLQVENAELKQLTKNSSTGLNE